MAKKNDPPVKIRHFRRDGVTEVFKFPTDAEGLAVLQAFCDFTDKVLARRQREGKQA